jgi:hypothetical protein
MRIRELSKEVKVSRITVHQPPVPGQQRRLDQQPALFLR